MFQTTLFTKLLPYIKTILQIKAPPVLEDNYQVRTYWEKKKRGIRAFFAVAIILFNLFGFELATPRYSLTREIVTSILDNISIVHEYIYKPKVDKVRNRLVGNPNSDPDMLSNIRIVRLANMLKWSSYGIFIIIFIFAFVNADPFSQPHLLLHIIDKEGRLYWKSFPNMNDLRLYAAVLPSNMLYLRCMKCKYSTYCENSLVEKRHKGNELWSRIFILLDHEWVSNTLGLINQCRKWHFVKYSLLYSSLFLTGVYLSVRIAEYSLPDLSVIWNWQLLSLIALSFSSFILLHRIDPSLGRVEEHLNGFYGSSEFKHHFKKEVCQREEPSELYSPKEPSSSPLLSVKAAYEEEIKNLKMVIDLLTCINQHRIDKMIEDLNFKKRRKLVIENVLSLIVHMYSTIYRDGSIFSASLLVPEDGELKTWITVRSDNGDQSGVQVSNIDRTLLFSISGSSLASLTWRHNKPFSANTGIKYLFENQEDTLKSIITFPIECSDNFYLWANEDKYEIDKIIGILCVTSSNGSVFSRRRCEINTIMIRPFISMIQYHYSLRVIERMEERTKNNG